MPQPDHPDIVFATIGDKSLRLDIYLPDGHESPPLLVWVHGGAWREGDKAPGRRQGSSLVPSVFVENGFATASVEYRLSTEAQFPAQVHDIKAAIRFLRARGSEYGFRTDRIAIGGVSAGAHLAVLVGVTNGHPELEGVYEEQGLDVFFDVVHGAGHGGDEFYMGDQLKHALHFMGRTMAR